MAFQLEGLGKLPGPVPRSAVKTSSNWLTVDTDDNCLGWWGESTHEYGASSHSAAAWGVLTTVEPTMFMLTMYWKIYRGISCLCHAIFMRVLLTVSRRLWICSKKSDRCAGWFFELPQWCQWAVWKSWTCRVVPRRFFGPTTSATQTFWPKFSRFRTNLYVIFLSSIIIYLVRHHITIRKFFRLLIPKI